MSIPKVKPCDIMETPLTARKMAQNIKPKKRLGQNFLAQTGVIQKLAAAAGIRPGQAVLEIGPGTGNLTEQLAKTGNKIIGVEKDREMIPGLKQRFGNAGNVQIINDDALKFDETKILPPYKIAANLPFYLAAPLIRKFLESPNPPQSLTVIVQKEVAQRICAAPPKMNLLAAATQFYAAVKIIDYVSRGCFWPVPKVDCAILQITPYIYEGERAAGGEPRPYGRANKKFVANFFRIVKAGFSQPRKQLANNLAKQLKLDKKTISKWLAANNIDPRQRPETLPLADWIKLTQTQAIHYNG